MFYAKNLSFDVTDLNSILAQRIVNCKANKPDIFDQTCFAWKIAVSIEIEARRLARNFLYRFSKGTNRVSSAFQIPILSIRCLFRVLVVSRMTSNMFVRSPETTIEANNTLRSRKYIAQSHTPIAARSCMGWGGVGEGLSSSAELNTNGGRELSGLSLDSDEIPRVVFCPRRLSSD